MPATPLFATAVHLTATGHVLAAVSSGKLEPTVDQLTGGDHFRVRFPGTSRYVDVPTTFLTATRVAVPADVLDRPQWYVLGDGAAPLKLVSKPSVGDVTIDDGIAGKKVVVVWQTADGSFPEDGVLDDEGKPPSATPDGATEQLVAYEGGKLYLKTLSA
jgi:hypothetical protein